MEYTTLGTSDLEVSRISMGLAGIPKNETVAIDTIHAAIDAGINYFDTAERYSNGYAEEVLGAALAERDRDEIHISTKVRASNLAPSDLRQACESSLDRLQTDYIDVYHIHWPNHEIPIETTIDTMRKLRQEGKIRHIAVCNFGPEDLDCLQEVERPITNQLPYSLLWRAIEYEIRDQCIETEVGMTCYSPLARGLLVPLWETVSDVPDEHAKTRWFSGDRPSTFHDGPGTEDVTFQTIDKIRSICNEIGISMVHAALAWVLSQPGVDHILVGGNSPEEIRDSAAAAEISLSDDLRRRLTDVTNELKETLGPNPDMWYGDSRYR